MIRRLYGAYLRWRLKRIAKKYGIFTKEYFAHITKMAKHKRKGSD